MFFLLPPRHNVQVNLSTLVSDSLQCWRPRGLIRSSGLAAVAVMIAKYMTVRYRNVNPNSRGTRAHHGLDIIPDTHHWLRVISGNMLVVCADHNPRYCHLINGASSSATESCVDTFYWYTTLDTSPMEELTQKHGLSTAFLFTTRVDGQQSPHPSQPSPAV